MASKSIINSSTWILINFESTFLFELIEYTKPLCFVKAWLVLWWVNRLISMFILIHTHFMIFQYRMRMSAMPIISVLSIFNISVNVWKNQMVHLEFILSHMLDMLINLIWLLSIVEFMLLVNWRFGLSIRNLLIASSSTQSRFWLWRLIDLNV